MEERMPPDPSEQIPTKDLSDRDSARSGAATDEDASLHRRESEALTELGQNTHVPAVAQLARGESRDELGLGTDSESIDDLIRELEGVGVPDNAIRAAEHGEGLLEDLLQPSPLLNRSPSCENLREDVMLAVAEELRRKSGTGLHVRELTYREMRQQLRQTRYEMRLEAQRRNEAINCNCLSFLWRRSERVVPESPVRVKVGKAPEQEVLVSPAGRPPRASYSAPVLSHLTDHEPERARVAVPAVDAFKHKAKLSEPSLQLQAMKASMKDVLKEKHAQNPDSALAITPLREILGAEAMSADNSTRSGSRDVSLRGRDVSLRGRAGSSRASPDSSRHSTRSVIRVMATRQLLAPVTPEEGLPLAITPRKQARGASRERVRQLGQAAAGWRRRPRLLAAVPPCHLARALPCAACRPNLFGGFAPVPARAGAR